MSIKKMPSKDFIKFTKKLNNLEDFNEKEKEAIYEKWQKEHHKYLKANIILKKQKAKTKVCLKFL